MNDNSTFHYSYSAKQNKEVQAIRQKYLPQEVNDKMIEKLFTKESESVEDAKSVCSEKTTINNVGLTFLKHFAKKSKTFAR